MGIQYRDYMRDRPPSGYGGMGSGGRDMVTTLIIANVVVFILQVVITRLPTEAEVNRMVQRQLQWDEWPAAVDVGEPDLELERARRLRDAQLREYFSQVRIHVVTRWFELDPQKVLYGQVWRLATYDFLHSTDSIWHLLFNMIVLHFAGRKVEAYYGSKEFLAFYLAAAVVSGICFVLWGVMFSDLTPAIGASGAVSAVMIAYAAHWPKDEWYLFGLLRIQAIWLAILTAAFDLHPMLLKLGQPTMMDDGIAHSAHVGGMAFGLLYALKDWRVLNWISFDFRLRRWKPSRFRVVHPETTAQSILQHAERNEARRQEVAERVDQLLAKIASQGEASLTEEERAFLAEASRIYRSRQ